MPSTDVSDRKLNFVTGGSGSIKLNQDVILVIEPNSGKILDFGQDKFIGLDLIGTKMLRLTLENGKQSALSCLVKEYDAPSEKIERDLNAFLTELSEKGLITLSNKYFDFHKLFLLTIMEWTKSFGKLLFQIPLQIIMRTSKKPNSFQVNSLLTLAFFSLRILGWKRSLTLFKNITSKGIKITDNPKELITMVDHLIRSIASRKLLSVACKERMR